MSDSRLPDPLVRLFETHEPEARLLRVWRGIEARRRKREVSRPLQAAFVATFMCSLAAFALLLWRDRPSPRVESPQRSAATRKEAGAALTATGSIVEPGSLARELDFGAGARVTVGPGARLDVLERTANIVTLALRRGLTQFDIRPGAARRWQIESGGVVVEVVGTQFSIERAVDTVRVEVQRGRVLVRGAAVPGRIQALDAGNALTVDAAPEAAQRVVEPPVQAGSALPSGAPARQRPAAASSRNDSQRWREAASERAWNAAWQELGADGVARNSNDLDDVADLFTLADVARLSGHPAAAITPLQRIVELHPNDPRAGVAAFTLGRVWFDALGNPGAAATAFQRALGLKLPQSLAEDAAARLVEALAISGDSVAAKAAAARYRDRYPNGARRAEVDRWSPAE